MSLFIYYNIFRELDEILSKRHTINPVYTIESSATLEIENNPTESENNPTESESSRAK